MKIHYEKRKISEVIEHWIKDYDQEKIQPYSRVDYWIDTSKGEIVFQLYIKDEDTNAEK